ASICSRLRQAWRISTAYFRGCRCLPAWQTLRSHAHHRWCARHPRADCGRTVLLASRDAPKEAWINPRHFFLPPARISRLGCRGAPHAPLEDETMQFGGKVVLAAVAAAFALTLGNSRAAVAAPKEIHIDWATYNPVSMVLKEKRLLENEFSKDGISI